MATKWRAGTLTDSKPTEDLRKIYKNYLKSFEEKYGYQEFNGPLTDADFNAIPQVLLIGQYSVGKSTFISHLLDDQIPEGMNIGPEPTTDGFMVIYHGAANSNIGGNTMVADPSLPFAEFGQFGRCFLEKFK